MKNNFFKKMAVAAILVGGLITTNSCKKFLDKRPITGFTSEVAFADEASALKTLLGTYSQLAGENTYGKVLSLYMMVDDDALLGPVYNSAGDQADRRSIAHYSVKPNNAEINKPFGQLYTGIERANLCIKYIPQMNGYESNANLKRMYGEALTLRAQFYFALVTNWGDLPAYFVPALDAPNLYTPKEDRDVIYDKIINDLKVAVDLVPWRSEVTKDERITKGAVKGVLARIALHRGGYSLRKNRTMQRGSNYLEYYIVARDQCRDIINSGEHNLNPSFKSIFKDAIDAHLIEPNGEVMFEVAMSGGAATSSSRMGNYDGPAVFGVTGQQNAIKVVPSYFYSFDSLDSRRDVTCAPYTNNVDVNRYMKNTTLGNISFGKYRLEWISNPSSFPNNSYNVNWPLLRYADVLLMFAEAENEISGSPTADAKDAFKKVRARAFGGDESLIGTIPSDKEGFFQAIVNERSFEFGGEGIRKYDLIRWNMLASAINDTKAKLATMLTGINPYPPYDSLPKSMMYKNASVTLEFANSFYHKTPSSTPVGFTKANWLAGYLNTTTTYLHYAQFFEANRSELMPIHQDVISDYQGKITQDYGY
jgi:starch-binding outer membrane protein, SusD/RagB family